MGATIKLFLSWMEPIFNFEGGRAGFPLSFERRGAYFIRSANPGES